MSSECRSRGQGHSAASSSPVAELTGLVEESVLARWPTEVPVHLPQRRRRRRPHERPGLELCWRTDKSRIGRHSRPGQQAVTLAVFLGSQAVPADRGSTSEKVVHFAMPAVSAQKAGLVGATVTSANYQTLTDPSTPASRCPPATERHPRRRPRSAYPCATEPARDR